MLKTLRKLECVYATAISLVISLIFWRFSSTEQLDFFYFAIALIILFISLWILLLQYLYYEDKLKAISQTHKRQSSNSNRSFKGNIIIVDNDEFSFTSNIPNLFKEGCIIKLTAKTDGLIKQLAYACVTNSQRWNPSKTPYAAPKWVSSQRNDYHFSCINSFWHFRNIRFK